MRTIRHCDFEDIRIDCSLPNPLAVEQVGTQRQHAIDRAQPERAAALEQIDTRGNLFARIGSLDRDMQADCVASPDGRGLLRTGHDRGQTHPSEESDSQSNGAVHRIHVEEVSSARDADERSVEHPHDIAASRACVAVRMSCRSFQQPNGSASTTHRCKLGRDPGNDDTESLYETLHRAGACRKRHFGTARGSLQDGPGRLHLLRRLRSTNASGGSPRLGSTLGVARGVW